MPYDSVSRKVYANLRSTNEVAEIDPATDTVLGTYPVEGCRYNRGMAIDSEQHRAFLLCGGTKTLLLLEAMERRRLSHEPLTPSSRHSAAVPKPRCCIRKAVHPLRLRLSVPYQLIDRYGKPRDPLPCEHYSGTIS